MGADGVPSQNEPQLKLCAYTNKRCLHLILKFGGTVREILPGGNSVTIRSAINQLDIPPTPLEEVSPP